MTEVAYGYGGWVRCRDARWPGPLYLRFRDDGGRPVLTELYLDGRGGEVRSAMLRDLDVGALAALVLEDRGWLASSERMAGPDLTLLASTFATAWGPNAHDWPALAWRAQIAGSGVERPTIAEEPYRAVSEPAPVAAPDDGITDAFLRSVADVYLWAVATRQRPAVVISAQAQVSPRTVHGWVRRARDRGILPPTTQGRAV